MTSTPSIVIAGLGAVSAAGWGVPALREGLRAHAPLSCVEGPRQRGRMRPVPKPDAPLAFMRHARLRRCSPVTRYATAASLEAVGEERAVAIKEGEYQLGILFTFMNGCVNYSNRFYGEVLADPSLASPILFPETVFNAPASHLAAMLGSRATAFTLVGDSAQYLGAVELALSWLGGDGYDGVLVVGAEELDWLSTEAATLFQRNAVVSEGAGALLLEKNGEAAGHSVIERISPTLTYHRERSRCQAMADLRTHLSPVDRSVCQDSLTPILGDAMGASLALQCVHACDLLEQRECQRINVLHAGGNQQAIGARFAQTLGAARES